MATGVKLKTKRKAAGGGWHRLRSVRLGRRLTSCFVLIILVMSVGSALLVWQVHLIRVQLDRLEFVDRELIAVLSFQNSLNSFHIRLNEFARRRDLNRLNAESDYLRKGLLDDVARAQAALNDLPSGMVRGSAAPSTLDVIQGSLPGYMDSLQSLANAGDWLALQDRLTNQLQPLDFLSTELVNNVDREVADERADATVSIQSAVKRMLLIVPLTGGFSLLIAGMLGIAITRSITGPLAHLMEGTKALARAEFQHQIPVTGEDEFAQLARAFNNTTTKLREQFTLRLEERIRERTRLARELHDTLLQTIQASKVVADTALDSPTDLRMTLVALGKLSTWMDQGMFEVRVALDSLRISNVVNGDLAHEIEFAMEEIINRGEAVVEFNTCGVVTTLHPVLHEEVYRIACEAIRNACVHAGGNLILVEMDYRDAFVLRVIDNGTGIDPDVAENGRAGHFGLQGMKERAARINGILTVNCALSRGTVVTLQIPNLNGYGG